MANHQLIDFIAYAITEHRGSEEYKIACDADEYDKQKNVTVNEYVKKLFTLTGSTIVDYTATNNKIASNFFHRLNTQRCTYSLGNGVTFSDNHEERTEVDENGMETTIEVDTTKEALGDHFDTDLYNLAYAALKHGRSFGFWNVDRLHIFPLTEFVPLVDEYDGTLRAGIRFWSLEWGRRPVTAVLYEEDGFTKYRSAPDTYGLDLVEIEPKHGYKQVIQHTEADGDEVIGETNYGPLPIVQLWGSNRQQSTLVGLRQSIDSYDLIQSGFANDLEDCAQIYWIIGNAMGMDDGDLQKFRDRLKFNHIAVADTNESSVTPYTQDIPFQARQAYLEHIKSTIYESFGALDVHAVQAGSTNDHIEAAYQPMDEEADDFEYQIIEFVQQLLKLIGIEDVPQFKRNRVSNQMEQVQMVMMEANYLDDRTVLELLPNIPVDKIDEILANRDAASADTMEYEDESEGDTESGIAVEDEDLEAQLAALDSDDEEDETLMALDALENGDDDEDDDEIEKQLQALMRELG